MPHHIHVRSTVLYFVLGIRRRRLPPGNVLSGGGSPNILDVVPSVGHEIDFRRISISQHPFLT